MANIDLPIEQLTLGETASVQVKSRASQSTLDTHMAHFEASCLPPTFFVCRSPDSQLSTNEALGVYVWTREPLVGDRGQVRTV